MSTLAELNINPGDKVLIPGKNGEPFPTVFIASLGVDALYSPASDVDPRLMVYNTKTGAFRTPHYDNPTADMQEDEILCEAIKTTFNGLERPKRD